MSKVQTDTCIVADPEVCHGTPTIKGTRIMVWQILELLEAGETPKQIQKAYPNLPQGAIKAVLRYAAQKAKGTRYVQFETEENQTKGHVFA